MSLANCTKMIKPNNHSERQIDSSSYLQNKWCTWELTSKRQADKREAWSFNRKSNFHVSPNWWGYHTPDSWLANPYSFVILNFKNKSSLHAPNLIQHPHTWPKCPNLSLNCHPSIPHHCFSLKFWAIEKEDDLLEEICAAFKSLVTAQLFKTPSPILVASICGQPIISKIDK